MASSYYLIGTEDGIVEGPFSLRDAIRIQKQNKNFDIQSVITKVVIDENGREVK